MTKEQLDKLIANGKTFDDIVYAVEEDSDYLVDRDVILDFAIQQVANDHLFLARHVLDAVDSDYADFYGYDMSMGTIDTPTAVKSVEDLYDYVD